MSIPRHKVFHFSSRSILVSNIRKIIRTDDDWEIIECDDVDNPGHKRIYRIPPGNIFACVEERYDEPVD